MKELLQKLKNRPLIDVWYYIQGNYRYYFWYGGKLSGRFALIAWLRKRVIRKFIKEQIEFRITVMNKECYEKGECVMCGCQTTNLQMSNKPCDKPCYPPMMNRSEWRRWKKCGTYIDKKRGIVWHGSGRDNRPFIYFKPIKNVHKS